MRSLLLGALGGGFAAGVVWLVANRAINAQLQAGAADLAPQVRQAVQEQVPPAVRRELEETLRRYNITPQTGQQLNAVLGLADTMGLIGLPTRRAW